MVQGLSGGVRFACSRRAVHHLQTRTLRGQQPENVLAMCGRTREPFAGCQIRSGVQDMPRLPVGFQIGALQNIINDPS